MRALLVAALSFPLAATSEAQTADISGYTDIEEFEVVGTNGERVGEVETVLIDASSTPTALVLEVDDGFLDLGDTEVVVELDALSWENGKYTTTLTSEDVEGLPVWDD